MTKEYAAKVAKALNDINDFELLFDEIEVTIRNVEGDFSDFYENQLVPMMKAELARREAVLKEM